MTKKISLPELTIEWDNYSRSEKVYLKDELIGVIIRPSNNYLKPGASIEDCTLKAYTLVDDDKLKPVYQVDVMNLKDCVIDDLKYVVANRILNEWYKHDYTRSVLI